MVIIWVFFSLPSNKMKISATTLLAKNGSVSCLKEKGGEGNSNSNCLELNLTSFTCSSSHTTNICICFHPTPVYTQWRVVSHYQSRQVGLDCHTQGRAALTNARAQTQIDPWIDKDVDLDGCRTACVHRATLLPPADVQ